MILNQILSFLKDVSILCVASSLKCLHSRVVMAFLFFITTPCTKQEGLAKPINKKNNCISVYQLELFESYFHLHFAT